MMHQRLVDSIEVVRANSRYRRYALARLSSTIGTNVARAALVVAGAAAAFCVRDVRRLGGHAEPS